jgi:hypothetical protein
MWLPCQDNAGACLHCVLDTLLHFTSGLRPWGDVLNPRFLAVPCREELRDRVPLNFSTFGYNYVLAVGLLCLPGIAFSVTFLLTLSFCGSLWYLYSLHVDPRATPVQAYLALVAGSLTLAALLCGNTLGVWCATVAASFVLLHSALHERGSYRTLPGEEDV